MGVRRANPESTRDTVSRRICIKQRGVPEQSFAIEKKNIKKIYNEKARYCDNRFIFDSADSRSRRSRMGGNTAIFGRSEDLPSAGIREIRDQSEGLRDQHRGADSRISERNDDDSRNQQVARQRAGDDVALVDQETDGNEPGRPGHERNTIKQAFGILAILARDRFELERHRLAADHRHRGNDLSPRGHCVEHASDTAEHRTSSGRRSLRYRRRGDRRFGSIGIDRSRRRSNFRGSRSKHHVGEARVAGELGIGRGQRRESELPVLHTRGIVPKSSSHSEVAAGNAQGENALFEELREGSARRDTEETGAGSRSRAKTKRFPRRSRLGRSRRRCRLPLARRGSDGHFLLDVRRLSRAIGHGSAPFSITHPRFDFEYLNILRDFLSFFLKMLFRNLGTQPTPGTGTATVLFNRNKRSLDDFNERTARILEYLDKYANTRS